HGPCQNKTPISPLDGGCDQLPRASRRRTSDTRPIPYEISLCDLLNRLIKFVHERRLRASTTFPFSAGGYGSVAALERKNTMAHSCADDTQPPQSSFEVPSGRIRRWQPDLRSEIPSASSQAGHSRP